MSNLKTGIPWAPDIRPESIETFYETYVPEGGGEQTVEYKIFNVNVIIGEVLSKFAFWRTHAKAVWYNKLANRTVADEINDLNAKLLWYVNNGYLPDPNQPIESTIYLLNNGAYNPDVSSQTTTFAMNGFTLSGRNMRRSDARNSAFGTNSPSTYKSSNIAGISRYKKVTTEFVWTASNYQTAGTFEGSLKILKNGNTYKSVNLPKNQSGVSKTIELDIEYAAGDTFAIQIDITTQGIFTLVIDIKNFAFVMSS